MRTIRSQMTLLLYKTLLSTFGKEGVLSVFTDEEIEVDGQTVSLVDFFKNLPDNPQPILSLSYLITLYERTETYLTQKSYPIDTFLDELISIQTKAFSISAVHDVLLVLEPFFHEAYHESNLYRFVFRIIEIVHKNQVNGSSFKLIHHNENDTGGTGTMQLFYDRDHPGSYAYDLTVWKNFIIKAVPKYINLPPFETVRVTAECRKIENIFSGEAIFFEGDILFVKGKRAGIKQAFAQFIESDPKYTDAFSPDGWRGILAEADIYEPETGRHLLRKGCFYGAPVCFMEMTYTKQKQTSKRIFQTLITAAGESKNENTPQDIAFLKAHNAFLESIEERIVVEYNQENMKLRINGTYLTRNFPAQLLYHLCKNRDSEEISKYSYQDIISQPQFTLNPNHPNLYVRIQRLKELLKENCSALSISQTQRGEFEFHSSLPISVIEL